MLYKKPSDVLKQLVRTALIASPGKTFVVADYSAIEARVLAWLAGETWRLDIFNSHGMIYEASASKMFGLPLEQCTKEADKSNGTTYRDKGKVAELALGYQGGVGALKAMGGERMGLGDAEMKTIVNKWRKSNTEINAFWTKVNRLAISAIKHSHPYTGPKGLIFDYRDGVLSIRLPSGRRLHYWGARLGTNRFDKVCVKYKGIDQYTRKWSTLETYGGKLTENIVQAIARDLLSVSMLKLDREGYDIAMHVHDEAAIEVAEDSAIPELKNMCAIMLEPIPWAKGLPLDAEGYITPYYKKD